MPTMEGIQIKPRDAEGQSCFFSIPQRVYEDQGTGHGSLPKNTDGSTPRPRSKGIITWMNHWCSKSQRRGGGGRAHQ